MSQKGKTLAYRRFAEGKYSERQIAQECGVSDRTIRRWRAEWRRVTGTTEPTPPAHDPDAPSLSEDWDAAAADPVGYWSARLRAATDYAAAAMSRGHSDAAASWERIAHAARQHLEKARQAHALEEERRARAEVRDPGELARRLLAQLPTLLEVAGDLDLAEQVVRDVSAWVARRRA